MAKIYTKDTWVDEVLAGPERFNVKDNAGAAPDAFADLTNCQIALATTVTTPGTQVTAARMNNIENGIDALDTLVDIHGATGKTTPADADELTMVDSAAAWARKKLTWANLKARINATLAGITGSQLANGTITATQLATPEAWNALTFQNSWANHGGSYSTGGYYKDLLGIVHLKGNIGVEGNPYTVIATLPVGYRPAADMNFVLWTPTLVEIAKILISASTGQITHLQGSTTWLSLDGVAFRTT